PTLAYRSGRSGDPMKGSSVVASPVVSPSGVLSPSVASSISHSSPGGPAITENGLLGLPPQQLRAALSNFLPAGATTVEKIAAIDVGLRSPVGEALRKVMARWIVDSIVPVDRLVPKAYEN